MSDELGYWYFREASLPATPALCQTPGCSRFTEPGRAFCLECEDQLRELDRVAFLRDRRDSRRSAFGRTIERVRRRLWIANLILVLGVLAFFACAWADAIADWLQAGGIFQ